MKNKLKKVIMGFNIIGTQGVAETNDFEVGETFEEECAINLGDAQVTDSQLQSLEHIGAMGNLQKYDDYLYSIEYSYLDEEYAKKCLKEEKYWVKPGACSSIRNGDFYGRNFDWYYNEEVDFVVRTKPTDKRLASIAVCGSLGALNKDFVASGVYSSIYRVLPFMAMDGINEKGVFCNSNVVPTKTPLFDHTTPLVEEKDEISCLMVPRYVLDHYSTALEAVEALRDNVNIYASKSLQKGGYDLHYMIGDIDGTYIVEFLPDENGVYQLDYHSTDTDLSIYDNKIMTNFTVNDVTFNSDGTVYTPATQDETHSATVTNGIDPLGSGLERYNLAISKYDDANTKAGMIQKQHNQVKPNIHAVLQIACTVMCLNNYPLKCWKYPKLTYQSERPFRSKRNGYESRKKL